MRALIRAEVQARISEAPGRPGTIRINPHHVTTAIGNLLRKGALVEPPPTATRGGRELGVLHLPITAGNKRRIERAAARKRLLHARYISWSQARPRFPHGLIGTAGERVVDASMRAPALASRYGMLYRPGREVTHVLGNPVPGGPLDNGAWVAADVGGVPGAPVLVLVEVKNVRQWIYPGTAELHDLLYKAAAVQRMNPQTLIVPMLVCRRRQYTTLNLGKEFGFYPFEATRQYLVPASDIDPAHVQEVRDGLGFTDLTMSVDADAQLVQALGRVVPREALGIAKRWQDVGVTFEDDFDALRDPHLSDRARKATVDGMRKAAREMLGDDMRGGW